VGEVAEGEAVVAVEGAGAEQAAEEGAGAEQVPTVFYSTEVMAERAAVEVQAEMAAEVVPVEMLERAAAVGGR
jgi:hypothetical protein